MEKITWKGRRGMKSGVVVADVGHNTLDVIDRNGNHVGVDKSLIITATK